MQLFGGEGVDDNGNGDPTEPTENEPTVDAITIDPAIGLAKSSNGFTDNGDGTYNITYGQVDALDAIVGRSQGGGAADPEPAAGAGTGVAGAVSGGDVTLTGTVDDERARLTAEYEVRVLSEGVVRVPFPLSGVGIESAEADGTLYQKRMPPLSSVPPVPASLAQAARVPSLTS